MQTETLSCLEMHEFIYLQISIDEVKHEDPSHTNEELHRWVKGAQVDAQYF